MWPQVANFADSGFANVKSLHGRVADASGADVTRARDLFVVTLPLAKDVGAKRNVAQLLKLYKEYTGAQRPFASGLVEYVSS